MTNEYEVPLVSIFTIVLVLLSGLPLISGPGAMNLANAKYATDIQTQANANECQDGTNCAINSPQTKGDGSARSPINLQISKFNEEQETLLLRPLPRPPSVDALIEVLTDILCPDDTVCPSEEDFQYKAVSLDGTTRFEPATFRGDEDGVTTKVIFSQAPDTDYEIFQVAPPTPRGLVLVETSTQGQCRGHVDMDDRPKTCQFINTYANPPFCGIINEYIAAPSAPTP